MLRRAAGHDARNAALCGHLPDVTILDLGLPDMDGMWLLGFVRKDSLSPIIVVSARNDDEDKVLALDAGANDYVTKPFSSAELLAHIRMVLRNYQHRADSGKLPGGTFRTQTLLIDYDARRVFVHGQEVGLFINREGNGIITDTLGCDVDYVVPDRCAAGVRLRFVSAGPNGGSRSTRLQ